MIRIECGDCLEVMGGLPDNSVDLIVTDPPYYRVKNEAWDRQWDNPAKFIEWIGLLCAEWHRLLKPNGSLYVFASPKMAARVEVKVDECFDVLNHITWQKPGSKYIPPFCGWDVQRSYTPMSERIVFAEHKGAENWAKGEAGYSAKCDELRGFVFEPLRAYLDGERRRAGVPHRTVISYLGMTGHDSHFFSPVQWKLPLSEQYAALRCLFNANGRDYLGREYEDLRREYEDLRREYEDLRREYEDLRREYEDLRRPFSVSAAVPYTDVWDFPTVSTYPGKHPCEKPLEMMRHIVRASSRPGALVLDCFAGSGTTGLAAKLEGRSAILIERDEKWVRRIHDRLKVERPTERRTSPIIDLPLFTTAAA